MGQNGMPEGWMGLLREEVDNAKEPSVMQMWYREEYSWVSSLLGSGGAGKAL